MMPEQISFKKRNIILLIVFYVLTLGLYRSFWYFGIAETINAAKKRIRIHRGLIVFGLIADFLAILSFVSLVFFGGTLLGRFFADFENTLAGVFSLAYLIRIYVSVRIKSFIEEYYYYEKKFEFVVSTPMIFFFNTLYLQNLLNRVVVFSDDPGILIRSSLEKTRNIPLSD